MTPDGSSTPPEGRGSGSGKTSSPGSSGSSGASGRGPKKPPYLLVALILSLVFGAECWSEGCDRLAFYRSDRDLTQDLNASIQNDADRGRAEALYGHYTTVADAARGRAIPVAAATFVLGAALLALASRALGGRTNARTPLMQVVAGQAVLMVVAFFLTRDVRNAYLDWSDQKAIILQHEMMPEQNQQMVAPIVQAIRIVAAPGWLGLRTIASVFIVIALTRPRSRAFFEAARNTAPER